MEQKWDHPLYKPVIMPLSELTTESYFKTGTLVRDWRDYHFCGRMFHPPLLASNWFPFCLCLYRDIYSTCCYCDILLRYAKHFCFISVQLHNTRLDFLFVLADSYVILCASWQVGTCLHPHDRAVCFEMLCYLYWYYFKWMLNWSYCI